MTLTFAYWDARGLGSSIRNLLRYTGVQYESIVFPLEGPPYTFENWFSVKFTLGFDFPNLPYLIDGDLKLTQSNAILKYLGRKFGMSATEEPATSIEDMVHCQVQDMFFRLIQTVYLKSYNSDEDFEAELDQLRKDLAAFLDLLENFLKKDWLTGEKISYVDFFAYEIIDYYRELIQKDCVEKRDKLNAYMKRFEELEPLRDFLASDEYRKAPIFGPFAKLGNKRKE